MTTNFFNRRWFAMLNKLKSLLKSVGLRGEDPVKTRQELINFIDSRAAFVSQVTLYTYVKARAGTQYPKLFENADFLTSLKMARWHIYGAAVCDLTLFAAAQLRVHGGLSNDAAEQFAASILDDILLNYPQDDIADDQFAAMCARGKQRAAIADWSDIAVGPAAFQSSSDAVFRWAPIADELKCDDEEILRNSIHLRWIGVRRDLKAVFQHAAIADDWHRHGATSAAQPAAK
jgi:hypothetical protein